MTDYANTPTPDLHKTRDQIDAEIKRRKAIEDAERQIQQVTASYSSAIGRRDGDDWAQPSGSYDAYPAGAVVVHDGNRWCSTIPGNVWTPGTAGWRIIPDEDKPAPMWVRPAGVFDAYRRGDRVTFEGDEYRSTIAENVWSPADYGWDRTDDDVDPEREWASQKSYSLGDEVTFNGHVYQCTQSHVAQDGWEPPAVPSMWREVG